MNIFVTLGLHKPEFITLSLVGTAIVGLFFAPTMASSNYALAASAPFALQDTKISGPDPTPGHGSHQAVGVLPQRNDTKIYVGTVTYSASTPVEVVVTHPFNLTQAANATGFIPEPLTIPGQNTALTILHEVGQGQQFDSIPFSGSSLAFHNRVGQNFTVSYSVGGNLIDSTGIPN
jgi:hypothetical protein